MGCIVALQTALIEPSLVKGIVMIDCSLRLQHNRKRSCLPWYRRIATPVCQTVLSYPPIGHTFFHRLAQPKAIRNMLLQAYGNPDTVTSELVDLIIAPTRERGAADAFLAFIHYSHGPLPEDLLPHITCPVLIIWGAADPWEPVELAYALAKFPIVEDFIVLDGVGHCPHDEVLEQVNTILQRWVAQHQSL